MDRSEARALTRTILHRWRADGTDTGQPRRIINSFRVYSPSALEQFLRRLDAAGYRVVTRGKPVEGEAVYCVRVETEATVEPTAKALDALTDDAARLAE